MKRSTKYTGQLVSLTLGWFGLTNYLAVPVPSAASVNQPSAAQATGVTIFAVTAGNNLLSFDSATPGTLSSTTPITGVQPGEAILGIDFRPRTGQLFALGSTSRVYTVNLTTGAATQVGATPFNPALNGTAFGFDFNPLPDRIRVVSDADQDLRLLPNAGVVDGVDGALAYAAGDAHAGANPNVVGAAYTYNVIATTLFGIDSNLDILVRQGSPDGTPISPNSGQLFTVGSLSVDTTAEVGFDIAALSGVAFASLTPSGATSSSLYTIDLTTGAATVVGTIGGTEVIRDVAVAIPALNLASVSAASFSGTALAGESIATAFGANLATRILVAVSLPLPTSLAGTTVKVLDSARIERLAPLFSVAPAQVNYLIPPETAAGVAVITLTSGGGTISTGVAQIVPVAPGVFSANANGRDAAAAAALRVKADGSQSFERVAQLDDAQGRFVTLPIDLGAETDQVILILFGTGIRSLSSLDAVTVSIGGVNAPVLFAGAQPIFVGLDQINVSLPRSLIGRGEMDVVLTVDGKTSNTVKINVK